MEYKNNIYFEKFISHIPDNIKKNIKLSKKCILKLLSYAKNMSDVNNILLIAGKDIITIFEISSFFEIILSWKFL